MRCGCPTIDLAVDGQASPFGGSTILADFEAHPPGGGLVGILLHARSGLLSELEVYSIDGVKSAFPLPRIEDIDAQ